MHCYVMRYLHLSVTVLPFHTRRREEKARKAQENLAINFIEDLKSMQIKYIEMQAAALEMPNGKELTVLCVKQRRDDLFLRYKILTCLPGP